MCAPSFCGDRTASGNQRFSRKLRISFGFRVNDLAALFHRDDEAQLLKLIDHALVIADWIRPTRPRSSRCPAVVTATTRRRCNP